MSKKFGAVVLLDPTWDIRCLTKLTLTFHKLFKGVRTFSAVSPVIQESSSCQNGNPCHWSRHLRQLCLKVFPVKWFCPRSDNPTNWLSGKWCSNVIHLLKYFITSSTITAIVHVIILYLITTKCLAIITCWATSCQLRQFQIQGWRLQSVCFHYAYPK